MIKIISPEQFKKVPWKNGKSVTTELAINDGGTLEDFDWRLSISRVVEDGEFSDFTGYMRNLILIAGNGIILQHDQTRIDRLDHVLSFATFDGACKTIGKLKAGPITDFNFMSKAGKYKVIVNTYMGRKNVKLLASTLCFIYCLNEIALLKSQDDKVDISLTAGHLIQLAKPDIDNLQIDGKNMIVIHLDALK